MFDVVVVGGGAGLSAALMPGRCRRRVLVGDGVLASVVFTAGEGVKAAVAINKALQSEEVKS